MRGVGPKLQPSTNIRLSSLFTLAQQLVLCTEHIEQLRAALPRTIEMPTQRLSLKARCAQSKPACSAGPASENVIRMEGLRAARNVCTGA